MLSGAFIGFFVAVIILVIIYTYTALRPVPAIGHDFGPHRESFEVATPPDEAFKVIEGLPVSTKLKLGRADAERRRVILEDGMTMKSYGYYYPVDVAPTGAGSTVTVGIKSKYPFQFGPIVKKQRDKQLAVVVGDVKAKLAGTI